MAERSGEHASQDRLENEDKRDVEERVRTFLELHETAIETPADHGLLLVLLAATEPGNYLSAVIASADRDTGAASVYFREALRSEPRSLDLIERAFAATLANGDAKDAYGWIDVTRELSILFDLDTRAEIRDLVEFLVGLK